MEDQLTLINKDAAVAWIQTQLNRLNIPITGNIEEAHTRPWSTVWRVPAANGDIYFKATPSVLVYEPALTQTLSRRHPDQIPAVLTADWEQGWMLLPDGGQRLREMLRGEGNSKRWETMLVWYRIVSSLEPSQRGDYAKPIPRSVKRAFNGQQTSVKT